MTLSKHATSKTIHEVSFLDENALSIPILRMLQDNGQPYPEVQLPKLDKEQALKMYRTMVTTRLLDERMLGAQRQGRISFYMQSLGEEAQIVASAAAIQDHDMIMAQYREQAALMYRGFTMEQFMNQLFSNEFDYGKGRQMPVHYGSNELHYMTISSPLATQIPQASGYAYAQRVSKQDAITLCYFGEGAASEGDFHAGLNMAAVLKAPVIFFCRNNGYAISTPTAEQYAGDGIASRGVGYGMKTIRVDGADTFAVYEAVRQARELMINDPQPVLIESITYRLGAHSSSDDPSGYRSKEEEERWRKLDATVRFKLWLIEQGWLNEDEDKAFIDDMRQSILAAMKRAEKLPKPPVRSLIEDVYETPPASLEKQFEELMDHVSRYPEKYPLASRGDK